MSNELKLEGAPADIEKVNLACDGCDFGDCDDAIYEALEEQFAKNELAIHQAGRFKTWKARKERKENRRIKMILQDEQVFRKFADRVTHEAKQDLLKSGRLSEFGRGEFMQWWWTWFSEGGAEKLIEFIGKLFEIIMSVNAVLAWAIALAIAGLSIFGMYVQQLI